MRLFRVALVVVPVLLTLACAGAGEKPDGAACSANPECASDCCHPDLYWCSYLDICMDGDSGTGSDSCGAGYAGPEYDVQSDSFCKAAYNYRCSGSDDEADANCAIYNQMEADNPGMPSCPYC
ncbi:MAG: hypothetical protein V4850_07845 [Myxococcota bacterium]